MISPYEHHLIDHKGGRDKKMVSFS
jgi:hypothetical protein